VPYWTCINLWGCTLTATVYAGVFAAKPVEVKLFSGRNFFYIARFACGMLAGTAHRATHIILISSVAGNLPPPPPTTPKNAQHFSTNAHESPSFQQGSLALDRFELAYRGHSGSIPPSDSSHQILALGANPGQFDRRLIQNGLLPAGKVEPPIPHRFSQNHQNYYDKHKRDHGIQPVIKNQSLGFGNLINRDASRHDLVGEIPGVG
jgi:hypothetical protein